MLKGVINHGAIASDDDDDAAAVKESEKERQRRDLAASSLARSLAQPQRSRGRASSFAFDTNRGMRAAILERGWANATAHIYC